MGCLQGAIPSKTYANLYTQPHARCTIKKLQRYDPPLGGRKETAMADQDKSTTFSTRKKQIGDTLCIIESAVSTDAKETAYNKIKRLIMDGADRCEQPPRAA